MGCNVPHITPKAPIGFGLDWALKTLPDDSPKFNHLLYFTYHFLYVQILQSHAKSLVRLFELLGLTGPHSLFSCSAVIAL